MSFRCMLTRCNAASLLIALFVFPLTLTAQTTHVVSPGDLQKQAAATSQQRQQDIERVRSFLANPAAAEALKKAKIDTEQVKKAVSQLSDQDLAQLAARADKTQHDFAAGYLSTIDIALIILGVALIILIIVVAK